MSSSGVKRLGKWGKPTGRAPENEDRMVTRLMSWVCIGFAAVFVYSVSTGQDVNASLLTDEAESRWNAPVAAPFQSAEPQKRFNEKTLARGERGLELGAAGTGRLNQSLVGG